MQLYGSQLKAYLGLGRATSALLGVLQISILAKVLPTDQYAVMAAAMAFATYIQLLGEPPILGYERLGHHERSEDSQTSGVRSSTYSVLALLAISVPTASLIVGVMVGKFWLSLAVGLWVVSLVQLRWASVQYLNWQEQQAFGTLVPANSVARTASLLVPAVLLGSATWTLMIGAVGSIAATAALSPKRPPLAIDWGKVRAVLRLGLPLAIASAAVTSLSAWPTLVASRFLNNEDFAGYAAQASLATAAFGSSVGFVVVFGFPQAKRAWDTSDKGLADRIVFRYLGYTASLGWLLILTFWFLGDWITRLLLGYQYSGSSIPVATIAMACIFGVSGLYGWVLRLEFRQNLLAYLYVSAALVQLPVVYFSTDRAGVGGLLIAMGCVAASLALVILAIVRAKHAVTAAVFVVATLGILMGAAFATG